ncbi:cyclic AMP-dependent transcription factor ATF-4 [Ornithorhynchus anatinus]|uniref:Cyclic AMP-dependent transcription factor ATF-4 n=1 Tax=Ornithorhynchus anatinus TaxID=9258 RepID=A0A6I8MXV3_ORNAN|nr:cyclic AMP-dependent transcription factor ATF-4 [Ornithorhynchus anatinus]
MTEMSFLSSEMMLGDLMSPFNQSCLAAEESLGLLDDYLEVAKHYRSHGFSGDKAKALSSEWLAVDSLGEATGNGKEDAFSGMDWMVEKMDLKEFDFDALLGMDDLDATILSEELMATLEDTCDLLDPLAQEANTEPPLTLNPIGHLPESLLKTEQVAPLPFLQPLPPEALTSTPDHSFSLELGSEVDVSEGDGKVEAVTYLVVTIPKCEREEEAPSDNDSGICMSPESYLGSPQHSPSTSMEPPNEGRRSADPPGPSGRPKPYDRPADGTTPAAKAKGEKKADKKLKKMEQNKTAATRYRQKKRAEQEALSGECRQLEQKNEALKERADSLSKEIQYLKDLIEEVRKAKEKRKAVDLG